MKIAYEIMHGERKVAEIDTQGHGRIYDKNFMPYHLNLKDTNANTNIDMLVDNITNFYYWCATRILTLDRQYAKEILNSIGVSQAITEGYEPAGGGSCSSCSDWIKPAKRDRERLVFGTGEGV